MTAVGDVGGDAAEGGVGAPDEEAALDGLAPSAKLVAKVLEEEGAMGFERVVRCTRLPRETARYGVDRLVEAGVAERRSGDEATAARIALVDDGER